ncbi:TetR/AcrR family transcriptional regulator [Pendulispora rubella]|uniref:TetR/AcrR family transcriptional regulator n=1 Tax=Pendulispora rubella TaxID=2741070 RepID=A0ABZ2KSK3_9BACT
METALVRALEQFWRHGYEGTSLSDLTAAMGINRPSLYATFGTKEELFRKALDLYFARYTNIDAILGEPTARAVAERLLFETVVLNTGISTPHGCLGTVAALACSVEVEPIRQELIARRACNQERLRLRLEEAKSSGELPADANPASLAFYLITVAQGIAVQAASGASREELRRVAELALRGWPAPRHE